MQAIRDIWQWGYTYDTHRDCLLLARELLNDSGSVFVQISDENLHHVREVGDEVFGPANFISTISFSKTTGSTGEEISSTTDFLIWWARDRERIRFQRIYKDKNAGLADPGPYSWIELSDGTRRRMTGDERSGVASLPPGARRFRFDNLQSQSMGRQKGEGAACWFPVNHQGKSYLPGAQNRWKTNELGMSRLTAAKRLIATTGGLYYVRYFEGFRSPAHC